MKTRRSIVRVLTCVFVAFGVLVVPALAAELIGRISKVDVEGKKIVVKEKDTSKEVEVKVTDDTVVIQRDMESKIDLEKLSKRVEKAKNGVSVTVTHENGVASKIKVAGKKKAEPKSER